VVDRGGDRAVFGRAEVVHRADQEGQRLVQRRPAGDRLRRGAQRAQQHQRDLRGVWVVSQEGDAAEPHHAPEVLLQHGIAVVVAARAVLAEVLLVAGQEGHLKLPLGGQGHLHQRRHRAHGFRPDDRRGAARREQFEGHRQV